MLKTVNAMQSYLQKLDKLLHEDPMDQVKQEVKEHVIQKDSDTITLGYLNYEMAPTIAKLQSIQTNVDYQHTMLCQISMQLENLSDRLCIMETFTEQFMTQRHSESAVSHKNTPVQIQEIQDQLDKTVETQGQLHKYHEESVQFDDASLQSSGSILQNHVLTDLNSVEVKHVIFDQDVKEPMELIQVEKVQEEEEEPVQEEPVQEEEEPVQEEPVQEEEEPVQEEVVQEEEEPVQEEEVVQEEEEEPVQEVIQEPVQEVIQEEPIQEPVQEVVQEVVQEEEEEEEEGLSLEEIQYNGETYYKDADSFIYKEVNGEIDDTAIGYWKEKTGTIAFYKNKK